MEWGCGSLCYPNHVSLSFPFIGWLVLLTSLLSAGKEKVINNFKWISHIGCVLGGLPVDDHCLKAVG